MKEITFIPKYSPVTFIAQFAAIALGSALTGVGAVTLLKREAQGAEMIFSVIVVGSGSLLMLWNTSRLFIKRIKFSAGGFMIERYLLPTKSISYDDIVDFGNNMIKTRQGNVSLRDMKNASELQDIFKKLIKNGRIDSEQLEGKLIRQEVTAVLIALPIAIIAFVLVAIAEYREIFPDGNEIFQRSSFLLFLVLICIAIYWYVKNKAK